MVWDETIFETIFLYYICVCAIKVEGYVIFLYEGYMYTWYDYRLCVCRGLCKPQTGDNECFMFFCIFQPMNVMTWD